MTSQLFADVLMIAVCLYRQTSALLHYSDRKGHYGGAPS